MPSPIAVLPLDVTGLSPGNLVLGENHSPLPGSRRLIIPRFGAFYKDGLRVYNPANNTDLSANQWSVADLWVEAAERSGKAVFNTIIITDVAAPAEIRIDYQAYGGPFSRSANELVEWLAQRRAELTGTLNYSELTEVPKYFNPANHYHLLAHTYGWERVIEELGLVEGAIDVGAGGAWSDAVMTIDTALESLRINSSQMIDTLVLNKFNEWKSELTLFYFGLDLMQNYELAGDWASAAAGSQFIAPSFQDDRYLDLKGLGTFAKSLVQRLIEVSDTGLGLGVGTVVEPQRGSLYVARIGSVFTLPTPKSAKNMIKTREGVYPTGYPEDDFFVVTKLSSDTTANGAFFKGLNPRTGDTYLGILTATRCSAPLTWHRFFAVDETLDLQQLVKDHIKTNNNPHDLTKDQILLENLENLPVVTVDDILSRTGTRKLVTMDALLYHMRAHMEGIELVRGADGLVDLNANPMSDAKIIFAPCNDDNPGGFPPKDQFISSFCDGTDKYVRWTDGKGGHVDKLAQSDSDDCKYVNVPKQGEKISEFCDGKNKKVKYADGKGGSTTETIKINDPDCGFADNMKAGEQIAVFCSGVNQMVRYADGHGGYYDMPSMINTYLCGGSIYPSAGGAGTPGGSPSPSGTPAPGTATLEYATSHQSITVGTSETITATLRGGQPNTQYEIEFKHSSAALGQNQPAGKHTITTDATGTASKVIMNGPYDGVTPPPSVYTSWVICEALGLVSNTIDRTFTGDTSAPPPPPAVATVIYSSNRTEIRPGDTETITSTLTGAAPNTTYMIEYWWYNPEAPAPTTRLAGTGQIVTDSTGRGTHVINNPADDGTTVPRGTYQSWTKVPSLGIESAHMTRKFLAGTTPTPSPSPPPTYNPSIVYATDTPTISPGTIEHITLTLTNAPPNQSFPIELWFTSTAVTPNTQKAVDAITITTDGTGRGSYMITQAPDNGTSIPRGVYSSWAKVPSLSIESPKVNRSFVGAPAPPPPTYNASLTYSTNAPSNVVTPGVPETITVTLSNAAPNTTYPFEFWVYSASLPSPQTRSAGNQSITTNAQGTGMFQVVTTDDGTSYPRGIYQSWAAVAALNVTSNKVNRSFVAAPPPPPPPPATLNYSSDRSTINPGQYENITVTLQNGAPNTTYTFEFWWYNPGQNPSTQNAGSKTFTTDAQGRAVYTQQNYDDGSVPRGSYTSWAKIPSLNLTSNQQVRTFAGTPPPPPPPPYNPTILYSNAPSTTITPGMTETQYVSVRQFMPNRTYEVQLWYRSLSTGQTGVGFTVYVQTNGSGNGDTSFTMYNDGSIKDTFQVWALAPETGTQSARFTRYLV